MRDRWYSIVLPKFNSIYSKPSKFGQRRPLKKKGRRERKVKDSERQFLLARVLNFCFKERKESNVN